MLAHSFLRSPVSPSLSVYPPPVFFLVCCSFFFLLVTKKTGHLLNAQAKLSNPFSYAIYSTYFIKVFFCLLNLSLLNTFEPPNNKKRLTSSLTWMFVHQSYKSYQQILCTHSSHFGADESFLCIKFTLPWPLHWCSTRAEKMKRLDYGSLFGQSKNILWPEQRYIFLFFSLTS